MAYKGSLINRWPRAFARLFDLLWEMVFIISLLVIFLNLDTSKVLSPKSLSFYALIFASLPLALALDAIIAGVFTNTPAKALIGVKVTSSRGERVGFVDHMRRNIGVWTEGLAMGIPPFSVLSMSKQYKRVSGRRDAFYDERLHTRVQTRGQYTAARVLIPLLLLLLLSFSFFALVISPG